MLCKNTNSAETFLLASAALANLTFMEPSAVHAMQRHETVKILVSAVMQTGETYVYYLESISVFLYYNYHVVLNTYGYNMKLLNFLEPSNGDASIKEPGDDSPLGKGKGNMSSSIYIQDQVRA